MDKNRMLLSDLGRKINVISRYPRQSLFRYQVSLCHSSAIQVNAFMRAFQDRRSNQEQLTNLDKRLHQKNMLLRKLVPMALTILRVLMLKNIFPETKITSFNTEKINHKWRTCTTQARLKVIHIVKTKQRLYPSCTA